MTPPRKTPTRGPVLKGASETLQGMEAPVTVQPLDEAGSGPQVDGEKLLAAWKVQADLMRRFVLVAEQTEQDNARTRRDNRRTRRLVVGIGLMLLLVVGGLSAQMNASFADVKRQMASVMTAVLASAATEAVDEGEREDQKAEAAAAVLEAYKVVVPAAEKQRQRMERQIRKRAQSVDAIRPAGPASN